MRLVQQLRKGRVLMIALACLLAPLAIDAQSDNCNSATTISLDSTGSACVDGNTVNATSSTYLHDTCNSSTVNEVWYTYTTQGNQQDFSVLPDSLTNSELVVYTGGCPDNGGTLQMCDAVLGSDTLNASWGIPTGTQVWIGVASNQGNEGNFDLCIDSYSASSANGNGCSGAIPICDNGVNMTFDMSNYTASGDDISCGSSANQDVWITFQIFSNGSIEWTGSPNSNTEYDWELHNITNDPCPGPTTACNYNYTSSDGCDFGMSSTSTTNCPISTFNGCPEEFCPDVTGNIGETYALQIDNYDADGNNFDFTWNGSASIEPVADFSISPSGITCGDSSVTVTINDNSNGNPEWTFGDGTSYTGQDPPDHTYNSPGVYAITATVGDTSTCMAQHTEYVEIYGPLILNDSIVQESCSGACDGEIHLSLEGGSGQYTYSWSNGATSPSITGLCAGTYSVTIEDTVCNTTIDTSYTISSNAPTGVSVDTTPETCAGSDGSVIITGVTGGDSPYQYNFDSTGFSSDTSYTGLTSGSYSLTVMDADSCTYDTSVTVPVDTISPHAEVAAPDTLTCTNTSVILDGSASTSAHGHTYSWSNGDSGSSTTVSSAGSYTLTVTDTGNSCVDDTTVTIPIDTTSPDPNVAAPDTITCTNTSVTLDASASTSANGHSYSWSNGDTGPTTTVSSSGNYTVTVTDTVNGCVDDTTVTVPLDTSS
ncbi:MAG: PKD domain-containing protein, partial [Flavobacteriales bacterium]